MRINYFISLCLLLASPAIAGENSPAFTLQSLQEYAIAHNPGLAAKELKANAARERVKTARSAYLPQVTGNAVRAFADDNTKIQAGSTLNSSTVLERTAVGLSFSQLIYDFGHTNALIASSKKAAVASEAEFASAQDAMLFEVTQAYFNVLRASSLLKVAEDTYASRQSLYDQIAALHDVKMKSDLDLSIARETLEEARILRLKAQNGVDDAMVTLADVIGYDDREPLVIDEHITIPAPPANLQSAIENALNHNPALAALKAKAEALNQEHIAAKDAHYPTVNALGFVGDTLAHPASQPIDDHYAAVGVNVSLPIFTGGRLTALEKESASNASAAKQELAAATSNLKRDIRISWNNTLTDYQNINVTEQLVKNSNVAYDLTSTRYNIGKSSIVDLTQAQLTKTQSAIAHANAIYEYLIERALLEYKIAHSL